MASGTEIPAVGCVVMAAGNAQRFGENKLAVQLEGKSLALRALEAVPADRFQRIVVVTQYREVMALGAERGWQVVENRQPDLGISHTIALGLEHTADCAATMFLVADQPLLRPETVAGLVDFWRARPDCIAALGHGGVRGNPCLFPARFYPELLSLTGDRGGSAVIRRHPEALALYEAPAEELADIDTPEALERLRDPE